MIGPFSFQTRIKCESVNLATCKVQSKMRKHFIADTLTHSQRWLLIFSSALYTMFVFGGCFDSDIKFRIFISHFIRCQFRCFAHCILFIPCPLSSLFQAVDWETDKLRPPCMICIVSHLTHTSVSSSGNITSKVIIHFLITPKSI